MFLNNKLDLGQVTKKQMLGLIIIAYAFSFAIRMIWVYQFSGDANFMWNHQLMINTNDGYFFASGAQHSLFGMHGDNPRVPSVWSYGLVFFTTLFAKITPFSLETIILYMPTVISSLVVIPIILISRLYKQILWGFFSALLGSIAWSYYNRTMTGYYDTDMFSAMAPMFILFFLIKSTIDLNLKTALFAAISIVIYPFLYDQGQAIIYAIGIIYGVYMLLFHRNENITYASLILIFIALIPIHLEEPLGYIIHFILLTIVYFGLQKEKFQDKKLLMISTLVVFILFLLLGNVFGLIIGKVISYTIKGSENGALHFYAVNQTVREAGRIHFETFANRTSGSILGVLIALAGYIVLLFRRPVFILALPLIGIGVFSLWGGLRFTVYAVPIAAMSAIYLFFVLSEFIHNMKVKYAFIVLATAFMIYPNIKHIIGYRVPTVFNKTEVKTLDRLKDISNPKDYTLTWWDYGYPIWYYSDTNTLIDGGKHDDDNFIISQILTTDSQIQAANLARVSVEQYVKKYKGVAKQLFEKNSKALNVSDVLKEMSLKDYVLPKKTRDIYLYLPNRMLNIFPTVAVFSNLDLNNGKKFPRHFFYISRRYRQSGNKLMLGNGVNFLNRTGQIELGRQKVSVNHFSVVAYDKRGKLHKQDQILDSNAPLNVIYMKNYNTILVLDNKMYNSLFIQLFVFENYDKKLFEPVVLNPLAKIYKLKI